MNMFKSLRVKAFLGLLVVVSAGSITGATSVMAYEPGEFEETVIGGLMPAQEIVGTVKIYEPGEFEETVIGGLMPG